MKNITFKNLDITINNSELVGIIGPNASGKTHLLRMISGRIQNDYIVVDGKNINNYSLEYKRNNIVCVFDDNIYNTSNVRNELRYYLEKLSLGVEEINSRINYFIEYFNLEELINLDFINMSTEDRIFIKILSLLIIEPALFCIDDLLTYLSKDKKIKILNYIKDKNITFLNVTNDMEELLLLDKVLILNKGKNVIYDKTISILENEKVFKELGISLPFIYDLNNMLKDYELINENHIVYRELVDLLWK